MSRAVLLASLVILAALPPAWAQQVKMTPAPLPVVSSTATTRTVQVQPVLSVAPEQAAPSGPYYPPPDALQGPLTAADVCRSLRGGLSEVEVTQDVRERGMVGTFGDDEAADARAAGASSNLVAALKAGRFTVSDAYARRYAKDDAKRRKGAEENAWRAENATKAQARERDKEIQRQSQLAETANRAAVAKEKEDQRRYESMKDKADWEQHQRDASNANNGYWYNGTWYPPYTSSSRRR